jgi:preprotein translocase subunit YajC
MRFDWTTIVAIVVIVIALGYLIMKRRQRKS